MHLKSLPAESSVDFNDYCTFRRPLISSLDTYCGIATDEDTCLAFKGAILAKCFLNKIDFSLPGCDALVRRIILKLQPSFRPRCKHCVLN